MKQIELQDGLWLVRVSGESSAIWNAEILAPETLPAFERLQEETEAEIDQALKELEEE